VQLPAALLPAAREVGRGPARRRRPVLTRSLAAALVLLAASTSAGEPDWPALAARIVHQLAPQPGEKVLLVAAPGRFPALVAELRYAIVEAGAVDLGAMEVLPSPLPPAWDPAVLARGARPAREALRRALAEADAAVILPGAAAIHPPYAALQDRMREGHGRVVHFHWEGAFPFAGQPLPPQEMIDAVYQKAVLETDYAALAAAQRRFRDALRQGEARVTTPLGTDLRFRVGDRPVTLQDGDASAARAREARVLIDREVELPPGAVRVAPLEDTVDGVIAYPPSRWDQRPVTGLRLRFERGRVVAVTADTGRAAVEAEMARGGEAARSFREFVLGLNPLLAVPERRPWIPYYGYGAGVLRLSLGDNSELGGAVRGDYVRWDFFTDATVRVGGDTWVEGGRLTR
jgi:hypothetical protein